MATTVSFGWFISFLFLVVIEIGGVARALDLEEIAEQELPPFFIGLFYLLDSGSQQRVQIPQLGRFNFLHGANLAIIFLGYVLVTDTTTGSTGALFSLITFIVWALLPLLEVDEYENVLRDGLRPVSYYYHVIVVTVTSVFVFAYDDIWATLVGTAPYPWAKQAVLVVVCLCLYYVMLFEFLKQLERELNRGDNERLPDRITRA